MNRSAGGLNKQQRGRGELKLLVMVVALGLVAAVAYLLVQETPNSVPERVTNTPLTAQEALPTEPPPTPDPVLTKEVLQRTQPPELVESPPDAEDPRPAGPAPVVAAAPVPALPTLNDSDSPFRDALIDLDPTRALAELLISEELIRKFVVVVDNMAEGRIPRKHSLLRPPTSKFKATEANGELWLDGFNFGRYSAYVRLVNALDVERCASLYLRYYPLMQQAYAELGYPRRSFHQRLLQALDHLLDSPVMPHPLALEQPSVMYKYVDPEIEQLSAVHKQMLRLGAVNARQVLERVTLLRTALGALEL